MMNKSIGLKSVLTFKSARDYLRHYYEFRKSLDPSFGYQILAKECQLKSVSYLQMVISGKRTLSIPCVHRVAEIAKLTFVEHQYFEVLTLLDGSKEKKDQSYYLKRLRELKK